MIRWSAALDQGGISNPSLRRDYDAQRRIVRRFAPAEYLAVRMLLPARLHPPVVAVVAFMHATDELIDRGDVAARRDALQSWDRRVREALKGNSTSGRPMLRTLADTTHRYPQMAERIEAFLDGAPAEAEWTGFENEHDFQAYVDGYSLPAFMLSASLLVSSASAEHEAFLGGCRSLIEAMQRIDFLADLAEDAEQGRVGIPREELTRAGLDVETIRSRPSACRPSVERLVSVQANAARTALAACADLPRLVERENQPFLRALIAVQALRLHEVKRKGAQLLERGAQPPAVPALRLLLRHYVAARRVRRTPS
ncbi:phytoene/squalene synthase family protein [Streptomyces sp. NPDC002004]